MSVGRELAQQAFDAWSRGDVEWLVEHSSPDIVVSQPGGFPDARTYQGREGMLEALQDWPSQWDAFEVVSAEVVAGSDSAAITFTRHLVRGRGGLEFELDVFNVFAYEDGMTRSWEMFVTLDEARARFNELSAR
jgi:ketosteroid isomerase-like protein